jgi:hypothetical protein
MKKISILFAFLLSVTAYSQTANSYLIGNVNTVINYTDNLGSVKELTIPNNSLHGSDSVAMVNFKSAIQSRIDTVTKPLAPVDYVRYISGQFTITGLKYIPVLQDYSNLPSNRRAIIDSLYTNILRIKGVSMSSFTTKFGSNLITINGIEYPYSDFTQDMQCATAFRNAIQLANNLYNGL